MASETRTASKNSNRKNPKNMSSLSETSRPHGQLLRPPELQSWIESKTLEGLDSIYLLPDIGTKADEDFYVYKMATVDEALQRQTFLTLSPRGVNEFHSDGDVRFLDLKQWLREYNIFLQFRRKRFFQQFRIIKAFRTWRSTVSRQKFLNAKNHVLENSCLHGNKSLRTSFFKVRSLLYQLETMGLTRISVKSTKHIKDFQDQQNEQIDKFRENFKQFRKALQKTVLDACKETFAEAGFSFEDYPNEVIIFQINTGSNDKRKASTTSGISQLPLQGNKPPKKLTFIEQANKRQCCLKIISFIRLVDLMLRHSLQHVVYNSVTVIIHQVTERSHKEISENYLNEDIAHKNTKHPRTHAERIQRQQYQDSIGTKRTEPATTPGAVEEQQIIPVFTLTVNVNVNGLITFTPELSVFESTFTDYTNKLNDMMREFNPLITDEVFQAFTQPILYGKLENYKPSHVDLFFSGHAERCAKLLERVVQKCVDGFQLCQSVMSQFSQTALQFGVKTVDDEGHSGETEGTGETEGVETDVEVLKSTMAKLQEQQTAIKGIKDWRAIAFFKVDLRLFKRKLLPNISSAIIKLQESLPRVGREKMEEFMKQSKRLHDCIEFEPKTTEEFVKNMDIIDRMNSLYDDLESRLQAIDNVYGIMNEIPIPITSEDKNSLKGLKSNMNSLGKKIQEKIQAQQNVRERFHDQLEIEERALKDSIKEAFKDVNNKALLDTEASIEEIKPTLKKIEKIIDHSRAKVQRFNEYERQFGFHETNYPELESSAVTLKALENLWNGVEQWDRLYDNWSTLNFEALDVNECRVKTEEIKSTLENVQSVLDDNPVAEELSSKVNAMLRNLPTLENLKTKSLRERHWKQMSDLIGSDMKVHKITLGFLEQNNIFNFADSVVEIIKSAKMEEQLDEMIKDLKLSWTEQALQMIIVKGIPLVADFPVIHDIIARSMATLKQLGSSQYSKEMRAQLLEWYCHIDQASYVVKLIEETQELWLKQDELMTSLTVEEIMPQAYEEFLETKRNLEACFRNLHSGKSLYDVFDDEKLQDTLEEIKSSLQKTAPYRRKVLWSIRCGSPWLLFLTETEVENLLSESVSNIRAIEPYLAKIFPWYGDLLLDPSTAERETKNGYHPVVHGVQSNDGEVLEFSNPMAARLEADYWIKCIANKIKHTLRNHSQMFFKSMDGQEHFEYNLEQWEGKGFPLQILCTSLFALVCEKRLDYPEKLNEILNSLKKMTTENILERRQNSNIIREENKLLLIEVCQKLLNSSEEEDKLFLMRFDRQKSVLRIDCCGSSFIYGYQYLGQKNFLTPLLWEIPDKILRILNAIVLRIPQTFDYGSHHELLHQLAGCFGKQLMSFIPQNGRPLKDFFMGIVATGSWAYLGKVEDFSTDLKTILEKLKFNELFDAKKLSFPESSVPIWNEHRIFMAYGHDNIISYSRGEFRNLGLVIPSERALLQNYLLKKISRPFVQDVVDKLLATLNELHINCLEHGNSYWWRWIRKMCHSVEITEVVNLSNIFRNFLTLSVHQDLKEVMHKIGDMNVATEFRKAIERQLSMDEQVLQEVLKPSILPESVLQSFMRVKKSLQHYSVTYIKKPLDPMTQKMISMLQNESYRNQTLSLIISLETQLRNKEFLKTLTEIVTIQRKKVVMFIFGNFRDNDIDILDGLCKKTDVHVLIMGSLVDSDDHPYLNTITLDVDMNFNVHWILTKHLSEFTRQLISDENFKAMVAIIEKIGKAISSSPEFDFLNLTSESLAITTTYMLNQMDEKEELTLKSLKDGLMNGLALIIPLSKQKVLLEILSSKLDDELKTREPILYKDKSLKPQLSMEDGSTEFFVPTKEMTRIVNTIFFYLKNHRGIILQGARGIGKSTAISKALDLLQRNLPDSIGIIEINVTNKTCFHFEDRILCESLQTRDTIVLVEGINFGLDSHVSYIQSLLRGRIYYHHHHKSYKKLPIPILILECTEIESKSTLFSALNGFQLDLTLISSRKPFDDDALILEKTLEVFGKNFASDVQACMQEIKSFILGWHKFMKQKFLILSDQHLYKVVTGILMATPDAISKPRLLYDHVINEIIAEYGTIILDMNISGLMKEFSSFYYGKFHQGSEQNFSLYTDTESGSQVKLIGLKEMTLMYKHEYGSIKGRAFNDHLTFAPNMVRRLTQLSRSYCRFPSTLIYGPSGSGKRSCVTFFSQFLQTEKVECSGDFRVLKTTVRNVFTKIMNKPTEILMHIVLPDDWLEASQWLNFIDDFLFYYDLDCFTEKEKHEQVFHTKEEEYEGLCNDSFLKEAVNKAEKLIQDHLHIIINVPDFLWEKTILSNPRLFVQSGIVAFPSWTVDTLMTIALDRFDTFESLPSEITGDLSLETIAVVLAQIHHQMKKKDSLTSSSHFLDAMKIFPEILKPVHHELNELESNLRRGIECVNKANGFIESLTSELAELEPQIHKLSDEMETLNKHLATERLSLDKASKSFRKKEVVARAKSEETQQLAADAHRNLEHALPSLEAAISALDTVDRTDLSEMRQIKNPPEMLQQVMEAVCILLGVKADWSTSKIILGDPYLVQKLIDYDKDNISDQISKRIKRYIDNPKFIPDEVSRVSKVACAFCMWVRAIDLYSKIFKSIEPKRIRLLQAESELSELMTALREETDRVAQIETTINNIQSQLQENSSKKATIEATIKDTNAKLDRARILSYSLEEESKKWQDELTLTKQHKDTLILDSIVATSLIVYGCSRTFLERESLVDEWKMICRKNGFNFSEDGRVNLMEFLGVRVLRSGLAKFDQYNQNYLSLTKTNKWSILCDRYNVSLEYLKTQNPSLEVVDYDDCNLVEILSRAASKGNEVYVRNILLPYPQDLSDLFERRMLEKVHAFVGLVGLPVMRKDYRIKIGQQEIVCHPKFFLYLHYSGDVDSIQVKARSKFNLIAYSPEPLAIQSLLTDHVMRCANFSEVSVRSRIHTQIDRLQVELNEKKHGVLKVLLESSERLLEDTSLIPSIKEAKARVFEVQNDLVLETKLLEDHDQSTLGFNKIATQVRSFIDLCSIIRNHDPSFDFVPSYIFSILDNLKPSTHAEKIPERVILEFIDRFVLSMHERIRIPFASAAHQIASGKELNENKLKDFKTFLEVDDLSLLTELSIEEGERLITSSLEAELVSRVVDASQRKAVIMLNDQNDSMGIDSKEFLLWMAKKSNSNFPTFIDASSVNRFQDFFDAITQESSSGWIIAFHLKPDILREISVADLNRFIQRGIFFLYNHELNFPMNLRDRFELFSLTLPRDLQRREKILGPLLKDNNKWTSKAVQLHLLMSEDIGTFQSLMLFKALQKELAKLQTEDYLNSIVKKVYNLRGEVR